MQDIRLNPSENRQGIFGHYCWRRARLRTPDTHWYIQIVETDVQDVLCVSAGVVEKCSSVHISACHLVLITNLFIGARVTNAGGWCLAR
jgi:hypothetical protein